MTEWPFVVSSDTNDVMSGVANIMCGVPHGSVPS